MAAIQATPRSHVKKGVISCLMLLALCSTVRGLRCYVCDNTASRACGLDFKAYQFEAYDCGHGEWKCGKQVQEKLPDGWVGVSRRCYEVGTLQGLNDTINACIFWYNTELNFSAEYCLCDRDFCNTAATTIGNGPATDPKTRALYLVSAVIAVLAPSSLSLSTVALAVIVACSTLWQTVTSTFPSFRLMNLVSLRPGLRDGNPGKRNEEKKRGFPDGITIVWYGTQSPVAGSRNLSTPMKKPVSSVRTGENDNTKNDKGEAHVRFAPFDGASFGERGKFIPSDPVSAFHHSVAFTPDPVHLDVMTAGSSWDVRPLMRSAASPLMKQC